MKRVLKRLTLASGLAAVMAFAYSGTASAAVLPNCVESKNLESIVDDSGSMSGSDSDEGRRQLIEILTDLNRDMMFGAVEFGTDANNLFTPIIPSGGNLTPSVFTGLGLIDADNGSTDYNAGFALGDTQNPGADARLFLSDGEPTETYTNGHRTPPKKTYVVGFGSPTISADGQALLNTIAAETGGPFHIVNSSADVLRVAMRINAALNCQTPPIERTLVFQPKGSSGLPFAEAAKKKKKKSRGKKVAFKPEGDTAQVVISYDVKGTDFKAAGAKQGKKGARRTVTTGENYLTINFFGLKKGKVKFNLVPTALLSTTTATVQILP